MAEQVTSTYRLAGLWAGKTVKFDDYLFVNGVMTAEYTEEQHGFLEKWLAQWGVKRDNGLCNLHPESAGGTTVEVQSAVSDRREGSADSANISGEGAASTDSNKPPNDVVPSGSGLEVSLTMQQERLRAAVMSLDPANDAQWTKAGLPDLASVEHAYKTAGVTRKLIEQVCPGYKRKKVSNG